MTQGQGSSFFSTETPRLLNTCYPKRSSASSPGTEGTASFTQGLLQPAQVLPQCLSRASTPVCHGWEPAAPRAQGGRGGCRCRGQLGSGRARQQQGLVLRPAVPQPQVRGPVQAAGAAEPCTRSVAGRAREGPCACTAAAAPDGAERQLRSICVRAPAASSTATILPAATRALAGRERQHLDNTRLGLPGLRG